MDPFGANGDTSDLSDVPVGSDVDTDNVALTPVFQDQLLSQGYLLQFRGIAHPTGENDDYDGLLLRRNEMERMALMMVGDPVLTEHEGESGKAGWLTSARVDDDSRLEVEGVIDRRTPQGRAAVKALRDGTLVGLSLGLGHLRQTDRRTGAMRIVGKTHEETSLTANPDLPGTQITGVAPDPPAWKLAESLTRGAIRQFQTKTALDKNRGALLQLFKDAAISTAAAAAALPASDPAPEQQQQLGTLQSQRSDSSKLLTDAYVDVDSDGRTRSPMSGTQLPASVAADSAATAAAAAATAAAVDAAAGASAAAAATAAAAAAAAATGDAPPPTGSAAPADLSVMEAMQRQVEELKKANAQMEEKHAESEAMLEQFRQNPDELKKIVGDHRLRMKEMSDHFAQHEEEVINKIIADTAAALGITLEEAAKRVPVDLLNAVRAAKEQPDRGAVLFEHLKTTAGAASQLQFTQAEIRYQSEKAENGRLLQRLDDANAAKLAAEKDAAYHKMVDEKKRGYSPLFGGPTEADGAAASKRARVGFGAGDDESASGSVAEASASAAAAAAASASAPAPGGAMTFGSSSMPVGVHAPNVVNPLRTQTDDASLGILAMFESRPHGQGMGVMAITNLTGKQYAPVRANYMTADGDLVPGRVEAEAQPHALPALTAPQVL